MTWQEVHKQGLMGQVEVMKRLIEKDYEVFLPAASHCSFDLVSYKNGKFSRISVKSTSYKAGPSWRVSLQQKGINNRFKKNFDITTSDVLAIYIAKENRVKFFKTSEVKNKSSISIKAL